jgi:chromosome segregation ATPase
LEHKIEELKHQILPKDEMIMDLRSQIDAMEDELNAVTRSQSELATQLEDAHGKLGSTVQDLNGERKRASKLAIQQKSLQKDLGGLVNIIQDAKALKETVGGICKKYNRVIEASATGTAIEDEGESKALEEILRQKSFLERLLNLFGIIYNIIMYNKIIWY